MSGPDPSLVALFGVGVIAYALGRLTSLALAIWKGRRERSDRARGVPVRRAS